MNPRPIISMLLALVIPYTSDESYGTRTIESKIDDTVAELVRENQTNAGKILQFDV